jgi:hypothetical protein
MGRRIQEMEKDTMSAQLKKDKCITCDTDLKKEELPENKKTLVLPFFPTPIPYECFICYCKRADLDGPKNNMHPNHKTDLKLHDEFINNLKEARAKRRKIN